MNKIISALLILFSVCLFVGGCVSTSIDSLGPYKNLSAKRIYQNGETALAKKDYDKAVRAFEALDSLYPFGQYAKRAQFDIIYAYYKNDQLAEALAAAGRYIRLYPRDQKTAYAYYMRGVINMGRSYTWVQKTFGADRANRDLAYVKQSFIDFAAVMRLYPHSYYAPDAHRRMLLIRNLLAQHELEVSQFYFKRRAYVAAANRANDVIQNYQGAPQVVPALVMLAKSYNQLGEDKLAQKAKALLLKNYPHSNAAKSLL